MKYVSCGKRDKVEVELFEIKVKKKSKTSLADSFSLAHFDLNPKITQKLISGSGIENLSHQEQSFQSITGLLSKLCY